jgi:virginiamycin B lyase
MKKAILLVASLLPLQLLAQDPNYRTSVPTIQMSDNTVWCATNNCLTPLGGNMSEIKAGADGTMYGLGASGGLYTYTAVSGWVDAPSALQTAGGNSITHISVASASQVLALSSAASPANNVFVLDPQGTSWTALSERLSTAEIGADGSIWGIDSKAAIWSYIRGSWTDPPGQLSNVAVASAGSVWGVDSSGDLLLWNGNAFVAAAPVPSFTPSQAKDAIAVIGGGNFLAVLDTAGGIHVLNNSAPALMPPQPLAITSLTCVLGSTQNGDVCTATANTIAGIHVGDSITIAGNNIGNGTWTVQAVTGCSPAPCIQWQGTKFGTAAGGTLTDNTVAQATSNTGKWSTIQGTASEITGGGPLTFVLAGGLTYHLNLTVPALTVTASVSHQCTRGGCILQTLTAHAYFGGPGGAHGTAGVTTQTSG